MEWKVMSIICGLFEFTTALCKNLKPFVTAHRLGTDTVPHRSTKLNMQVHKKKLKWWHAMCVCTLMYTSMAVKNQYDIPALAHRFLSRIADI